MVNNLSGTGNRSLYNCKCLIYPPITHWLSTDSLSLYHNESISGSSSDLS